MNRGVSQRQSTLSAAVAGGILTVVLAASFTAVNLLWAPILLAVLGGLWLIWIKPVSALWLLILSFPLQKVIVPLGVTTLSISRVLLLAVVGYYFIRGRGGAANRRLRFGRPVHVFHLLLGCLFVLGAGSMLFSDHFDVALTTMGSQFFAMLFYVLTVWALSRLTGDADTVTWCVVKAFVWSGVLSALLGLGGLVAKRAGFDNPFVWPYSDRVVSTFLDYEFFGNYLVTVFPFSVVLASRAKSRFSRWMYVLAGVALLAGVVSSLTRGAWIALVVSMAPLVTNRRVMVSVLIVGMVVGLLVFPIVSSRFTTGLESGFVRIRLWEAGLSMVADYPFTGVGPGNFEYRYFDYAPPGIEYDWKPPLHRPVPHSVILEMLAERGIPSLLTLAAIIFQLSRVARSQSGDPALRAAIISSLLAFGTSTLVLDGLYLVHLWAIVALVVYRYSYFTSVAQGTRELNA